MLHLLLAFGLLVGDAGTSVPPVNLLTSGNYVILAKAGVSTTGVTAITGNLGISPIASTAYTGFGATLASNGQYATSAAVTGLLYAADMAAPTPSILTTAIGDMGTAYSDAAGRTPPDFTNLGTGDISGLTLAPGLYNWGSGVVINADVTILGTATDVWIFQIAQGLTIASGMSVHLATGAQASNIFWQVSGQTNIGAGAHFEGTVLCATAVALLSGASINGHILSQTSVTLTAATIVPSVLIAAPVVLSTVVDYAILSSAGVANTGMTNIIGNLGISPATTAAYTGFGTLSTSGPYATSASVTGRLYAADMAAPTPTVLAAAIIDMNAAYNNAAGRTPPDFMAVGAGAIGGLILTPGLYSWSTSVTIGANVTLVGDATKIWVFQIAGSLTMANGTAIILTQGALTSNVVWQVAGTTTIGPNAYFQGTLLCASAVSLQAQATFNGRIMSRAAVSLNAASVNPNPNSTTHQSSGALPAFGSASLFATAVAALILSVGLGFAAETAELKAAVSPAIPAVDLQTAGKFVILSKAGVSTTGTTAITGNLGISPIATTAFTGFGLKLASNGQFATCPAVTGDLYAANMAAPTPSVLTVAIGDMEAAYTNAAGRVGPHFVAFGAGSLGGLTLTPGLYTWGTAVLIDSDITLAGSSTSVWILQIAETLTLASGKSVILAEGARAQNVFWQVAGTTTLGTGSHLQGIILGATSVVLQTGAKVNGRILAQTFVALDAATVVQP